MSEFRHMTTFSFSTRLFKYLQDSLRINRNEGQIVFSYPDKTTIGLSLRFMTMSQPPTADYIARSSICIVTRIHIDLYQLTP